MWSNALGLLAVAVPIAISIRDWQLWQSLLGGVAVLFYVLSIVLDHMGRRPYVTRLASSDWNPTGDGGFFAEIGSSQHRKRYPTFKVEKVRSDGGRDHVSIGGYVLPNGTVRLEGLSRTDYEVTIF